MRKAALLANLSVCLCDLLIVIAKHEHTGNCNLRNVKGKLVVNNGIRDINAMFSVPYPVMIEASRTCFAAH